MSQRQYDIERELANERERLRLRELERRPSWFWYCCLLVGWLVVLGTSITAIVLVATSSSSDNDDCCECPAPTESPITGLNSGISVDVLIAGAGFAGIEAARVLAEQNIDFMIVEASGRVGGRVQEKQFGGYVLENGANWIQGLNGNPIFDLLQAYGMKGLRNNFDNLVLYDENNVFVPKPYSTPDGAEADAAYAGAATYSRRCLQPSKPNLNQNTLRFCRDIKGNFVNGAPGDDQSNAEGEELFNGFVATTALKRLFQYYSQDFEWAESPGVTSLNNTLPPNSYVDFRDANYMALNDPLGYARLILKHAATFLQTSQNTDTHVVFDDERLSLRTRVLSVDRSKSQYVDVKVCSTAAVGLHTGLRFICMPQTTRVIRAKHFISTFSIGVLAQSVTEASLPASATRTAPRFVPPLPAPVAKAIGQYPMALYSKLFFRFPWKFWQNEQMLLSAANGGDFAPVWQSLDLPKFLPGSNIIFLTVTGERARQLQEMPNSAATDTAIIEELLPVLNNIFPTQIAAKTGGRLLERADVLEFSMARWLQDDLTRGMYSNWRANRTWEEQEPTRAQLGRVWFSGEHTCFRYNGYVHGAFLAGRRTANLLLSKAYGRNVDLATLCDQSPAQLTGTQKTLADDEYPHSTGFPRAADPASA